MAAHDLGIYKVEKQVDLDSDEQIVDLACDTGDYALDGMWRIDHADQDEDDTDTSFLGRAVDVEWAYPTDGGDADDEYEGYQFKFVKNAFGRAQAKVFLTCIRGKTDQANGHQHVIPVESSPPIVAGAPVANKVTGQQSCPLNSFVATPGFKIDRSVGDEDPYMGHVERSWAFDIDTWEWQIDVAPDNGATVTLYASCVNRKVPIAGGEKHKLVYKLQGPESNSLPATSIRTKRIECRAHYKAVVAGFQFVGAVPFSNVTLDEGIFSLPHWWWLGMDPQPKNRDFRFLNSSVTAATNSVQLKALCLNYRTT